MKFGYFYSSRSKESSPSENYQKIVSQVNAAETAGFDLAWAGHHYLVPDRHMFQPTVSIPRLAAETESIHLGMNILLPLHHPVAIAEQFATMDVLSGGRTILGPITGYRDKEFESFGVPKHERARRLTEGVKIIKKLWTEESVTYDGQHFSVTDATISPQPIQHPRPPIWIGANKDKAVKRAAALGDAWLVNPHETNDTISRQLDLINQPTGEGFHGVQPIVRDAFVAETDEEAFDAFGPYLEEFYDWYDDVGQGEAMETPEALDLKRDVWDRFLIGSPQTVIEKIVHLHEAYDIDCVILFMDRPGIVQDDLHNSIELVGEEVIPAVRNRL
ncbi:hypothetical protein EL22_27770 [Halostagnicola sp. A56]|uniref:LLM class flavin-dependent oxidoreductase n=1 Tax=Halostagnicola sp. A56 TaxID=1495067 RepID=UPI0004A1A32B|nr:LLM class flavin-dependent oxidoreductase [Halostagnicola sp. A56]KMT45762.1 hypothetical protein EL22_27770 [Halostagnicola sp. A56]